MSDPTSAAEATGFPGLDFGETAALDLGENSGTALFEPVSESGKPGSLVAESLDPVLDPVLGDVNEPLKYVVQATMSNSRRM